MMAAFSQNALIIWDKQNMSLIYILFKKFSVTNISL